MTHGSPRTRIQHSTKDVGKIQLGAKYMWGKKDLWSTTTLSQIWYKTGTESLWNASRKSNMTCWTLPVTLSDPLGPFQPLKNHCSVHTFIIKTNHLYCIISVANASIRLLTCNTHTHTHNLWLCLGQLGWAGTRRNIHPLTPIVSSVIPYLLHLLRSMASSLFNLHAWESFSTISLQVCFGLPVGLAPSTSYSIHFFTQLLSSFRSICPYHCNLFLCSTGIMPHIHLTILISACWSATSFTFLTGQVSLPCNILLCTQLLYNLPLTFNDISYW